MPVNPLFMDRASCDTIDADENAEPRVPDEPLIASYLNYLVTNHGVIVLPSMENRSIALL